MYSFTAARSLATSHSTKNRVQYPTSAPTSSLPEPVLEEGEPWQNIGMFLFCNEFSLDQKYFITQQII